MGHRVKDNLCFLLLILFQFCLLSDGVITGWTVPPITGDSGNGSISVYESQTTYFLFEDLNAVSSSSGSVHCCSYNYREQAPPFLVLTDGGIQITSSLDYETRQTYTIVVSALDQANDEGTATVTISVLDVNEATPIFSDSPYSACVANGTSSGTLIKTVHATDGDTHNTVNYNITGGNTNGDFAINSASGDVSVNGGVTLDSSVTGAYSIIVECADDGSPPRTGTTTLSVTVGSCDSGVTLTPSVATVCISLFMACFQFF